MRHKRVVDMKQALTLVFGKQPREVRLAGLWSNWSMVMGRDLAALAWPLGARKHTLLLGGEDGMAMQELVLLREEILERANAFMDEAFFSDVHVSLALGKRPLDALPFLPIRERDPALPPKLSGTALSGDSAAARCYAAFAALARK